MAEQERPEPPRGGPPPDDGLYRLIVESARDFGIFATDLEGRVTLWSAGAHRVLGWTPEEVLGRPADFIWTPEDLAARMPERERERALRDGRAVDERWHLRHDGARFWASGLLMPLIGDDGEAVGFTKVLRDRTAERAAVEEVRRDRDSLAGRLRALLARLDRTEQRERQRLASELHDNLAQVLSGVRLKLDTLRLDLADAGGNEGVVRALDDLHGYVREALGHTRALMDDLSPPPVLEGDLAGALHRAAAHAGRQGLRVTVEDDGAPKPLGGYALVVAYQTVRELLINVGKHAGTDAAHVRVERVGDAVRIHVEDLGRGLGAAVPREPGVEGGFGLFRARERAAELGGRLDLHSLQPGGATPAGTRVTLTLPLGDEPDPLEEGAPA